MPFTDPYVANPYPYAFAVTITSNNSAYEIVENFVSGVYTISWSGGGTIQVDFYNGNTFIGSATGTSSITYNLSQSATKAILWNSVSSVSVVLSLTALAAAPVSGQLLTFSTSQTITTVGSAYFCLVGAGGGSAGGTGGSGAIVTGRVTLTGSLPFVAGVAGSPGLGNSFGTSGTSSTFAGFTAPGGGGSLVGGTAGVGGSPNGVSGQTGGGNGFATATAATISGFPFLTMGSTGTGGVGAAGTGQGSGIGTGGLGSGSTGSPGGDAIGFGSSGGGTPGSTQFGGNSTGGVLYLFVFA